MISILFACIVLILCIAAISDIRTRTVSNGLILLGLFIYLLAISAGLLLSFDETADLIGDSASGALISFLLFGGVYLASRGNFGAGDVKISFLMGLYLTSQFVFNAYLASCITAVLYVAVRRNMRTLPFIPFLFMGTIFEVIFYSISSPI